MTIASHAVEIFRQGVWASLTGGWCYDPRQTLACNIVHMYLWLFLFLLPLLITLCFNITWPVVGVYALIVGGLFSILKILNYYLHTIFDTHDPIDVVVAANAEDEEDDEENGLRDVEEGVVVMDEENQSDADNRRNQGGSANAAPASTLYETLGENSLAASSSGVGLYPDDDEVEFVTWESARGVANTGTTEELTKENDDDEEEYTFFDQRRRLRRQPKKKMRTKKKTNVGATATSTTSGNNNKEDSAAGGVQMSSSPDYLAVEADVHSMPNESTAKDDILDVDNIELRAVRSDSKLATTTSTGQGGQGCSSSLTTADIEITPTIKNEQSPNGRRIIFQSNDTEINKSQDEKEDDDNEEEDGEEFEEENADDDEEEGEADENEDAAASSSMSLAWFKRKYSECSEEEIFKRKYSGSVGAEQQGAADMKNAGEEEVGSRRDSFGRKRRSGKKGVVVSSNSGNNAVRRTRSTVETYAQGRGTGGGAVDGGGVGTASTSSTLLSETCLEKCRGKGVRKSYPGKTSSTDIFLLQHVGARKQQGDGFRPMNTQSNSVGSCGTGLEESNLMGADESSGGSQRVGTGNGDKLGLNSAVGRVARFHSVDVPLTDIPERESESERADGFLDLEPPNLSNARAGSIMESSLTTTTTMTNSLTTTDAYGTSRSDGGRGTTVSFYSTAAEESPPSTMSRARGGSSERLHRRRRRWASTDDQSPQSPRRKLIQNLRDTLETLKSETSTTGSSSGNTAGQADRFVVDLKALKDASTPDLRWLFDDAAAVLHASTSYRHAVSSSSAGSSPVSRPRLASLNAPPDSTTISSSLSKRDRASESSTIETPSLPTTLSRVCTPGPSAAANVAAAAVDQSSIQQQFRERLMEEIKRLLEEIIDSHPEALEAIESVRQAKLARIARRAVGNVEGGGASSELRMTASGNDSYLGDDEDGFVDTATITFEDNDAPGPSHRGGGGGCSSELDQSGKSKKGSKTDARDGRSATSGQETSAETEDGQLDDSGSGVEPRTSRGSATSERTLTGSTRTETVLGENLALAELARRRNVHVARTHDDTSEGAVHYFQDSDGKWYTYTFNDGGAATAQLLGSDRALMELIAEQQEEAESRTAARQQNRSGRSKMDGSRTRDRRADSSAAGRSSSRRRQQQQQSQSISRSGYRATQRQSQSQPQPLRIVLARTGSSSSEESFLALDAPASILHVGGTGGPTASGGGGAVSISRGLAAAGETPSSGRVALPLRLHRHSSGGNQSGGLGATPSAGSARRRASGARQFVPLRQMLNRTGGGSVQFPTSGGSLSLMPRLDSLAGQGGVGFPHHGNNHDDMLTPGDLYSGLDITSSNFLTLSGSLRTPSDLSHSSFRARFLATLAGGVDGLPSMIGAANTLGAAQAASSASSMKRKQYYRVSICPRLGLSCCCPTWLTSRLAEWKFWTRRSVEQEPKQRSKCCPKRTFKLRLDRLRLMAMFDRNRTKLSAFVDVLLAVLVAFVACGVLSRPLYYDLTFVLACVVTAGAQFSLMKSVQPDAASPVHGYNSLAAYSRPVYYCIFGLMVYLFDRFYAYHPPNPYATETLYSTWPERWEFWWNGLKDFWSTGFLFLPIIFTFGLLPQLNTFAIYVLEQVDMLIFGGTASVGLASGVFSVTRSIVCSSILFVLNYLAMQHHQPPSRSTQNVLFSAFCGCSVALSYLLSRSSSDPRLLGFLFRFASDRSCFRRLSFSNNQNRDGVDQNGKEAEGDEEAEMIRNQLKNRSYRKRQKSISTEDPLPAQLRETMILRTKHDSLAALILGILYFALHCSTAFTVFNKTLIYVLPSVAVGVGLLCHYLLPQLRQHTPWRILAAPLLKTHEHRMFDVDSMARLMSFERLYATLNLLERNVFYPLVVLFLLTASGEELSKRYGIYWASIMMSVASMKLLRTSYCNAAQLYLPLAVTILFSFVDFPSLSLTLILDFYILTLIYPKFIELTLKLQFIFSYVAPWQISWGSAFHAFAQPTAIPHSAFTLAITTISSFLSAPLNPFLGSAVFLMSYVRPVKFWEKNYNTKRVDHSNTRLISQIDRGPMTDDSNLNAIFYEHLTRSLQRSLAGDLQLGRLASNVSSGDCFILASFYLNCLVHVVEVGNGFVTFQLRGLEFRGTYCQQREVEAISEEIGDQGCCCCGGDGAGSQANCCCVRGFLSLNAVWNLSWLSWRVTAAKFVLEGYSVSDNSALSLLQVIELRKLLVTLYVKCILFYTLKSGKLEEWLCTETIVAALESITKDQKYVDVDPSFCAANDDDYDSRLNGISRQSFCQHFLPWIEYCRGRRRPPDDEDGLECRKESLLTAFCFGLALVGRRVLGAAAQGRHTSGAESFLYGLHALFKGDFRITCARDEWVFADMDILKFVIAPAVRMALKLHQDHFTAPDDFESMEYLYDSIDHYDRTIFISHENDPAWRHAVLTNTPSLLALRHVFEDGQDDFKIIMLNRRHMNFRVIALNRECVRAFWAGQQQELIFLRNRNPERGSIQNARQVLRNMINSSADQPIGYPIYVSPLTTSFCETHEQISKCVGPPLTLNLIGRWCSRLWHRLTERCGTSGSSNLTPTSATLASTQPAAGLVHFRSSSSNFGGGGGGMMAETSLTERRQPEQRQQQSTSRTRPTPRPRTSLMNQAANRRDAGTVGSGRASLGGRSAGITSQRPPHPPPRHGSAPPIMQRSMTHPLRAASITSHLFRHHPQRTNDQIQTSQSPFQMTPSRSRESLTLRQMVVGAMPRNSVVVATGRGGSADSTSGGPRVSLGSLLALNVEDETNLGPTTSTNVGASTSGGGGRRGERVRIVDNSSGVVLDNLDKYASAAVGRTPVAWPYEDWRRRGGKQSWKFWRPQKGMEGSVVHKWTPWHPDPKRRSHLDKTILLVNILDGKYYVPILELGVEWIGDEL